MDSSWILDKITIEYKSFGKHKGKYVGEVRFENNEYESFKFNIYPEMAEKYLNLIKGEVIKSANELGDKLSKSIQK